MQSWIRMALCLHRPCDAAGDKFSFRLTEAKALAKTHGEQKTEEKTTSQGQVYTV